MSSRGRRQGEIAPALAAQLRGEHVRETMNKAETRYAAELDLRLHAGEIQEWSFEPIRLRLSSDRLDQKAARSAWYTPDFLVVRDRVLELHEVKGRWEEAALVRIRVAASLYPCFRFLVVLAERFSFRSVLVTNSATPDELGEPPPITPEEEIQMGLREPST